MANPFCTLNQTYFATAKKLRILKYDEVVFLPFRHYASLTNFPDKSTNAYLGTTQALLKVLNIISVEHIIDS